MMDMNELELALDDCLQRMMGGASLSDCLSRYPGRAAELKPMLEVAVGMARGQDIRPWRSYKIRARSRLMDYWQAHPRKRSVFSPLALRLTSAIAVALAILMLAGTAYAQNALPGQPFYGWKVASEKAWRAVAPNQVAVDLSIANRRADELTAVVQQRGGMDRQEQALQDYYQSLQQLQSDANPSDQGQIMQALEAHKKKFSQAGIDDPQLDAVLHGKP